MSLTLEEAKKLSPDAINRVIAESLGWSFPYEGSPTIGIPPKEWKNPNPWKMSEDGFGGYNVPDFFHDLNACHEAEASFEHDFQTFGDYWASLQDLSKGQWVFRASANIRAIALVVVLSERKTK